MIDNTRCICLKNKNASIQCLNKRLDGSEYCGVHNRSKKKYRYDNYIASNPVINNTSIKIIDTNEIKESNSTVEDHQFYQLDDFRNSNYFRKLKVNVLRNTMIKFKLPCNRKTKKKIMCERLLRFLTSISYIKQELPKVIKIQRWYRSLLFLKRVRCKNDDDFYSNQSKFEVHLPNIFIIKDISNNFYWFNVETFDILLSKSDSKVKNPYSSNEIDDFYITKFRNKYKNIDSPDLEEGMNDKQKFRNKMLMLFQKFNLLDNYADHKWFEELTIVQLQKLYIIAEDIWNYRAELSNEAKYKIVQNGQAFTIKPYVVKKSFNKRWIQDLLLTEFDRLCMEGKTNEDKKLGAMLALTALVEVSIPAANAMPQYIQSIHGQ